MGASAPARDTHAASGRALAAVESRLYGYFYYRIEYRASTQTTGPQQGQSGDEGSNGICKVGVTFPRRGDPTYLGFIQVVDLVHQEQTDSATGRTATQQVTVKRLSLERRSDRAPSGTFRGRVSGNRWFATYSGRGRYPMSWIVSGGINYHPPKGSSGHDLVADAGWPIPSRSSTAQISVDLNGATSRQLNTTAEMYDVCSPDMAQAYSHRFLASNLTGLYGDWTGTMTPQFRGAPGYVPRSPTPYSVKVSWDLKPNPLWKG